ncbi:MAG: helix-turn-helix transcriptional regulator [Succinivibrio sp.]|nr:helix-turn-helix transcriptional regulator [Succinivibrio sp.]
MSLEREKLKEVIKRGNNLFPLSSYIWTKEHYDNQVKLHWHKELEFVRFIKGDFACVENMQEFKITDRAVLLIPGNITHSFFLPKMSEESAVVFNPEILSLNYYDGVEHDVMPGLASGQIALPPPIFPGDPFFEEIDSALDFVVSNASAKNQSMRLRIKARLIEVIALMYEGGYLVSKTKTKSKSFSKKDDRVKELLSIINEHFTETLRVEDVADRLGLSKEYFCRFFKRSFGSSFIDYLIDMRLEKAAEDLVMTDKPVVQVCSSNGYPNIGYFFRSFKKKFGCTPAEYRKKLGKKQ